MDNRISTTQDEFRAMIELTSRVPTTFVMVEYMAGYAIVFPQRDLNEEESALVRTLRNNGWRSVLLDSEEIGVYKQP